MTILLTISSLGFLPKILIDSEINHLAQIANTVVCSMNYLPNVKNKPSKVISNLRDRTTDLSNSSPEKDVLTAVLRPHGNTAWR